MHPFTNRGGQPDVKPVPEELGVWVKFKEIEENLGTAKAEAFGICALCGEEGVVEQKKDSKRQWGQELPEVLVTERYWDCPNCKEAYVDHEQSQATEHQMFHAYTTMFIAFRRKLLEMLGEA
jgi:hypothetical protein